MQEFLEELDVQMLTGEDLKRLSPEKFAYIGDAVYELHIRTYAISTNKNRIHMVNRMSVKYVRASAQAYAVKNMQEFLSEEEWLLVKRGRNQKTISSPKNANITDYKYATGFETLIGYLYLKEEIGRLTEIIAKAITIIESMEE
jgi:ribonuclease-3 family protein